MCAETLQHMAQACRELRHERLCGIGLWGDAMPCNWDRSQSVMAFVISFPGLTDQWSVLRLPVLVIMKHHMVAHKTVDDVCEVLRWSFVALACGEFPTSRHDGGNWSPEDSQRSRKAGMSLGTRGVLAEVRGDWLFF